jgi:hypothetical protein
LKYHLDDQRYVSSTKALRYDLHLNIFQKNENRA